MHSVDIDNRCSLKKGLENEQLICDSDTNEQNYVIIVKYKDTFIVRKPQD